MLDPHLRRAVLDNLADLPDASRVAVACSGGADSVALLRVTAALRPNVVALIVDHGLQLGSAIVAEHTAELARELGAEPYVLTVQVPTGSGVGGPEAAARTARRTALAETAQSTGSAAVLLGHTLDDQAETVLLGLARGSGARSLAGMREVDGIWRRPFLNLRRSAVRSSVADLQTHEDPHNLDPSFARVRVRTSLLPLAEELLGPGVAEALARTADLLRDDADALDALVDALEWSNAVTDLLVLPRAVRTRVLRRALIAAGSPAGALTREHVLSVDALLTDWHGQGPLNLPGGVEVVRESGRLSIKR